MIIKILIILLAALSTSSKADYVDIGFESNFAMASKVFFNGVIVDAKTSDEKRVGIGYGWQDKSTQVYIGGGYTSLEQVYFFSELTHKNGRHSIYDLTIEYVNSRPVASLGYTHLVSENAGLIAKHNFTDNILFFGIRRWF